MKKILSLLIVSQLLIGCAEKNTPGTIDFGPFTIYAPAGWHEVSLQGIDSYVGRLTNEVDTLTFDYGWYSYDLGREDPFTHLFALDTINGKIATVIKPKITGQGTIGIYIVDAYKNNRFNLIGSNIQDEQTIWKIFKSIQFPDSDTIINSENNTPNFTSKEYSLSSKNIFKANCASCHHISDRYLTGPGFATIEKDRFNQWFFDNSFVYTPERPNDNMGPEYHRKMYEYFTAPDFQLIIALLKTEADTMGPTDKIKGK